MNIFLDNMSAGKSNDNVKPEEAIEKIVKIAEIQKMVWSRETFQRMQNELIELWKEMESSLPVYTEDEIREVVKRRVGKVYFDRCIEVARSLGGAERPVRFIEIREDVRGSFSFEGVGNGSMNKVLNRTLNSMIQAGLVLKSEFRNEVSGRSTDVLYFRLFRLPRRSEECKNCWVREKLKEFLEYL